MNWDERLNTPIKVGETYKTRDNKIVIILKKQQDNFLVKNTNPSKFNTSYLKEYFVNKFGGFGNYPNHYDLIKKLK